MTRKKIKSKPKKKELDFFKYMAKDQKGSCVVSEMREEKIVPTILTSFNRAVGIGGLPLGCVIIIHGPNQVGKTVLALAIIESLRLRGFFTKIYDSEYAGEKAWYSSISGKSQYTATNRLNLIIGEVQSMFDKLAKLRVDKVDVGDVGFAFLADSLTEMVPDGMLEKILKSIKEGKGIGRMYPEQAYAVSMWVKFLLDGLYRNNSTGLMVLQERDNIGKGLFDKDYKPTGGTSLQYNNRLRMRVYFSKKIIVEKKIVGQEIRYTVENNKIVGTTFERGTIFTATGDEPGVPKGLDLVREALHEAKERKWLEGDKKTVKISIGRKVLLKTKHGMIGAGKILRKQPDKFKELVDALNKEYT